MRPEQIWSLVFYDSMLLYEYNWISVKVAYLRNFKSPIYSSWTNMTAYSILKYITALSF